MTAVQQSAAPHPAVRQRIDWIDTAKGLCMILVIVGHTLPLSLIHISEPTRPY